MGPQAKLIGSEPPSRAGRYRLRCALFFVCSAILMVAGGCGFIHKRPPAIYHKVVSGDTLSGIAASYGTDLETLLRINRFEDPNRIAPGDRIRLPAGARRKSDSAATSRALSKGVPVNRVNAQKRAKQGSLCHPIGSGSKMTSGFGPRNGKMHRGVDFAAPIGTSVRAAGKGEVVHVGRNGTGPGRTYGNYLVLHHGKGLYTLYAHLDRITVKKGSRVNRKEQIGTVGSTGRSTGPHLHFEVIEGIEEVDPLPYFPEA